MKKFSLRRVLHEPLFHFFLLGLGIFFLYDSLNLDSPNDSADGYIIIDTEDVGRLVQQFEATWQRRPTQPELAGLVDALVREEILVREAIALGLDQGDGIIRNRLAQKMTFLTTSVAQSMLPEDAVLIAHMETNRDRFTIPGRLAFDQVWLADVSESAAALAALSAGAAPEEVSVRSMLPPSMILSSARTVDGTFGRDFYAGLVDLPENVWAGPVQSGYGAHLVRLTDREEPRLPPLDSIRNQVLADWHRERSDELTAAQIDAFRADYEIETPPPEALLQWTAK